jgi:thiol-disulfide isomerase/thioredoxin
MDSVDRLIKEVVRRGACLLFALLCAYFVLLSHEATAAEIGSRISAFRLPDTSGAMQTVPSHAGKAVAIIFWSYKCPVSLAYVDRIEELDRKYAGKGVEIVAVDANINETAAEIRANTANLKLTIPVLLDSGGSVSEKLGATHSPSVFLLDGKGILQYKGAFDNNKRPGESGRVSYVEDALDAILAGREVRATEMRPFGCSIRPAKENR